jgi:hypothetical protein
VELPLPLPLPRATSDERTQAAGRARRPRRAGRCPAPAPAFAVCTGVLRAKHKTRLKHEQVGGSADAGKTQKQHRQVGGCKAMLVLVRFPGPLRGKKMRPCPPPTTSNFFPTRAPNPPSPSRRCAKRLRRVYIPPLCLPCVHCILLCGRSCTPTEKLGIANHLLPHASPILPPAPRFPGIAARFTLHALCFTPHALCLTPHPLQAEPREEVSSLPDGLNALGD